MRVVAEELRKLLVVFMPSAVKHIALFYVYMTELLHMLGAAPDLVKALFKHIAYAVFLLPAHVISTNVYVAHRIDQRMDGRHPAVPL